MAPRLAWPRRARSTIGAPSDSAGCSSTAPPFIERLAGDASQNRHVTEQSRRVRSPEVRENLGRFRSLRVDEGFDSDAARAQAPSGNPESTAELGAGRPAPAPRIERANCCQFSLVE